MPLTAVFCIIGSLSISGFPFFSGFVSKSMILTAGGEGHMLLLSLALLVASAGVVAHSGIKIPFFAFFAHDSGKRVQEAPLNMLIAMAGAAALCIGIGVYPAPLYAILPFPVDYLPYTGPHILTSLQLLLFAALAFALMMRYGIYPPELRSTNLDTEWIYRKALPSLLTLLYQVGSEWQRSLQAGISSLYTAGLGAARQAYRPPGLLGEPWPTGATAMWAAILLGVYLVGYYF